jgi:prepilin-type N-terminal cleavage/methylation domain-containing protein
VATATLVNSQADLHGVISLRETSRPRETSRSRRACSIQAAFTLLELLTVIAIIGILSTLLLSVLSSARKSSHRARCISNLHQISLSLHMYLDDFNQRPPNYAAPVQNRYLANANVLLCPSDKFGGWGSLVQPGAWDTGFSTTVRGPTEAASEPAPEIRVSYLHPLDWQDISWQSLIQKGSQAGLAACQLHGLGHPDLSAPSVYDFQGLIFRAQFDGAVVKRQVFWAAAPPPATFVDNSVPNSLAPEKSASAAGSPWQLFSDEPIP